MRVWVDLDACKGHAQSEDAAPEVFHVNDEGLADVLIEHPDESLRPKVDEAARLCPEECILIAED
jgi:ferredoxin